MLNGKHVVLGITGGIAAYKSAILLRLFVKSGAEVQVVMTPSAREFITPVTLSALSGKPVISEFFTANTGQWNSHVDIGLWADAVVIAPATACTIGKMAHGVADNMLVTTYLSAKAPVFVAPAMDLDMMAHPSTVANIELLRSYGNHIIEPEEGELASHLVGKGRMAEPATILAAVETYFAKGQDLKGRKALVTAGPTQERIDPVRYISNYSSGKMGYAIAEELARRGADVTLVTGPVALKARHPRITAVPVVTACQMLDASREAFADADIAVMTAAVADYRVENPATGKIKREGHNAPELKLVKNPDIAATLGAEKRQGQLIVGFALETDNAEANAVAKLRSKNLDFVVLNTPDGVTSGFGTDNNTITIIKADGSLSHYDNKPKTLVAADVVDVIASLL